MFHLRSGYLISGILTGMFLLINFIWTLPDGKLHVIFCNVGQGDASYVRFPDGRDMVIDGGPSGNKLMDCISRHMPFWDRTIDLVLLTHPQKDHYGGLVDLINRYNVKSFVSSDIAGDEGHINLLKSVKAKLIPYSTVLRGSASYVGQVKLAFVWPSKSLVSDGNRISLMYNQIDKKKDLSILGIKTVELNDYSAVLQISYGSFDAIFTGDADERVNSDIKFDLEDPIEVLKVPHHGSRNAFAAGFLERIKPEFAVISVGKNSYGHPSEEIIGKLTKIGSIVKRTDEDGEIEVISDGNSWTYR